MGARRLRIFLGAFGDPGHAFPMLALGSRLVERGHEVTFETWTRWRTDVEEAAAAIPNELIDMVSLAGPADVVRDRLSAFREAGVGTLMITPMAFTRDERIEQLRLVAELAG